MGKIILKPISILDFVQPKFLEIKKEGTTFTVKQSYNLNGTTYTLPKNTTLVFEDGGQIINGTIVGNNSVIIADRKVFNNVVLKGTWKCVGNVGWWARGTEIATNQNNVSEADSIQNALDSSFSELIFPPLMFYISKTLELKKPKRLIFQGRKLRWPLSWLRNQDPSTYTNTCIIFTKSNIDMLKIDIKDGDITNTTEIIGGNFDVSLSNIFDTEYNSSVIKVMANDNQKLWGLNINTNIIGHYMSTTGVGIDLNPSLISMTENNKKLVDPTDTTKGYYLPLNSAFITNVRIDSDISYIGTGIRAKHYGDDKNWLTDMIIDGNIRYCPTAIDTSAGCTINASIQAGKHWIEKFNNAALIYVRGSADVAIGGFIFDIYQGDSSGNYSNRYAVSVETGAIVTAFGKFEIFLLAFNYYKVSPVKGKIYNHVLKESFYNGENNKELSAIVIENYNLLKDNNNETVFVNGVPVIDVDKIHNVLGKNTNSLTKIQEL